MKNNIQEKEIFIMMNNNFTNGATNNNSNNNGGFIMSKVRNIKSYLLASLFNAGSTISSYYRAEVNHDMPQFVG